jgi:hypothetical protein
MRSIVGLSVMGLFAFGIAEGRAQYPGYPGDPNSGSGGGYGNPGLYGGGLNPYLNLRGRGGLNAATNYYNFVRPYTGGTYGNAFVPSGYGTPAVRRSLFPNLRPVYDEDPTTQKLEEDKKGIMRTEMPPAGHGAGFMNQMNFFGQLQGSGAAAGRRTR